MTHASIRYFLLLAVSLLAGSTAGGAAVLSPNTLYNLLVAEFAGRRQQLPTAIEYYQKAAEETRHPEIVERAAQIAFLGENTQKALKMIQLWLALDPNNLAANRMLAALFIKTNQTVEAIPPIQKLIQLTQNKPRLEWLQTVSFLVSDCEMPAILAEILKKEIRVFKQRPELPLSVAMLLMNTKATEAMFYTEQALTLDPKWEQAILIKTKLFIEDKKTKEALAFLENIEKISTLPLGVRQAYAHLLLDAKALKQAEQQFLILNQREPNNVDTLFALALIYTNQRHYKAAEKYLNQVDKLAPDSPNIQFYRGYIHEQQQLFDKAIAFYSSVSEGSNYFIAQLQVAHLFAKQEKWGEAIAHLQTIRTETPDEEIQLYTAEAGILSASHNGDKAITLLNQAHQKYKDNIEILYTRALVQQQLQRLPEVETDLRTILIKEPKNVRALNALGYTLADQTTRYEEAKEFIVEALNLDPENPAILDSMGWVYYRLGDFKQALYYLEKAYQRNQDGEIAAHLAEVYFTNSQKIKARTLLKKAIKQEPEHPLLKKVIQKLMPTSAH